MLVLEYDNLGLYVKFSNAGFSLTEYLDEATTFNKEPNSNYLDFMDKRLSKNVSFYELGKLHTKNI